MTFLDDYEPVEDRLRAFWSEHPNGRVLTSFIEGSGMQPGEVILFRADVWRDADGPSRPDASGFAHQRILEEPPLGRNGRPNESAPEWTSPFEVAETSAIGRALANLGYAAKGKRPSREEMRKTKGVSPAVGNETGSGSAPRSVNPSEQGHSSATEGKPEEPNDVAEDRTAGGEATPSMRAPSTRGADREEPPPAVSTKGRRCLHLKGTKTVDRAAGGRVEVCVECGVVIETVMLP